jgi:glyoxylase-like metal-dependent hydrolase (beta-lactamase superfamily II)
VVDVKVQTDMPLQVGDLSLELIMAPGHTAGSMCVYHKDTNILFSGDAINGSGAPYKVPFVRIDLDMMLETYKKLNRYEVEWLLPGHGGVVHGGNQRILESIEELKLLPDRILTFLKSQPSTSLQIADALLVWPETVEVTLRKLERDGKARKIEEKTSTTSNKWTISSA